MESRYVATMVLSGAGDALGYKNGEWEFCHSGSAIHDELVKLGGIHQIEVKLPKWMISDDTVLHIATGEALIDAGINAPLEEIRKKLALKYKEGMNDMTGRAPGNTTMMACHNLKPGRDKGLDTPFNQRGGGCGAAMRAMCIGLLYSMDEEMLIAVAIESGCLTHHHPTGYLGAVAAAGMVSYAIQGIPIKLWGKLILNAVEKAKQHIINQKRYVDENLKEFSYFTDEWTKYLKMRGIFHGEGDPKPLNHDDDIKMRDAFYKSLSFRGWGGSSGHDAPMIAYDALLMSGKSWSELCSRSMFHSGDSDSTGVIAAACYGAMYGFEGVPEKNYNKVEYHDRLTRIGKELFALTSSKHPLDSSK